MELRREIKLPGSNEYLCFETNNSRTWSSGFHFHMVFLVRRFELYHLLPGSPWFSHGHTLKAAKRAISAILQDADVTDQKLQTCFTGVESLLNSRPLTIISDDANDEPALTSNHFIIGQMGGDRVADSVDMTDSLPENPAR